MHFIGQLIIVLAVLLRYAHSSSIKFPTRDSFPTMCKFPDNSNGTCLNIKYCPAAITAKNVSECYTGGRDQYVCCKNDLWSDLRRTRLTAGCGEPVFYIVNGLRTEYKEFPYMAALGWDTTFSKDPYDYKCGGVLIYHNYVLTAAHCAHLNGLAPSVVLLGGGNLSGSSNKPLKIIEVIIHPDYRHNESYHDIALLKLEKEVIHSPICPWSIYSMDGINVTAIGYGHTQFAGAGSEDLLKTHLSIVPNNECSSHFADDDSLPHGIKQTQLCAKDSERDSDTCQGDSGGPLILHSTNKYDFKTPFLVGITSFGRGCAMDPPGVYTRVSEYVDWIEEVLFTPTKKT